LTREPTSVLLCVLVSDPLVQPSRTQRIPASIHYGQREMTDIRTDSESQPGQSWLRRVFIAIGGVLILLTGATIMLLVSLLTLFQTRRFCCEVIAAAMGRAALKISRVKLVVHGSPPAEARQWIYISNHTSTLDMFAVIALSLPRTRYFLSGFLRKILPLGLVGYLIRVFWTAPYSFPEKRRAIFQHADSVLRATGDSVYLTPEGSRILTGEIAHFNRGAFHLATSLQADIVPMYVQTTHPKDSGMELVSEPGVVHLHFLPVISTAGWQTEDIDANRDAVHQLYQKYHSVYVEPGGDVLKVTE